MEFFMVRHHIYNGEDIGDTDDIIPCSSSQKGMDYLTNLASTPKFRYYAWETDDYGFKILICRGPGKYAYDYYYLESMIMDEEI
jgi:hypothetical protein